MFQQKNKMLNKKPGYNYIKKYEFLLTGAVVFIFVLFLTIKLMIPNIIKAGEIHNEKIALEKKLENLERKNKLLMSSDDKLLKENFVKLNYVIPESKDYSLLFTTLDTLQERLGISITRTDFELGSVSTTSALIAKNNLNGSFVIPITLEVIGTTEQLQSFLSHLSDLSGRLISLEGVKILLINPGLVKATLTGKTYFRK